MVAKSNCCNYRDLNAGVNGFLKLFSSRGKTQDYGKEPCQSQVGWCATKRKPIFSEFVQRK